MSPASLPADNHGQPEALACSLTGKPTQIAKEPQRVRRPELLPAQSLPLEEREQVAKVVTIGAQRVRREPPIDHMLEEPAYHLHRTALVIQQPDLADDATFTDLDHAHRGILDSTSVRLQTTRRRPSQEPLKVSR
jgi:hypothetical protein